jgi:3-deoxy-D-manno-octulosonic-acid transferase
MIYTPYMPKTLQQQLINERSILPYKFLLVLLLPYLLLITLKKAFSGGGFKYFAQRFGFSLPRIKHPVWFHGASVGEINALIPLINAYKKKHPKQNILLTCNTPTAYQIIQKQPWQHYQYCYLPIDLAGPVDSFILLLNPTKAIIMETELWPNLYAACARNETTITIVNGRVSDKTLKANAIIKKAYRFCMEKVSYIYARSEQDKAGFLSLGITHDKIKTLGNIKYQTQTAPNNHDKIGRPFILLASSHDDEELQIATMWKAHPLAKDMLLVIAPRHPERCNNIVKQLKALGLNIAIRSKGQTITPDTQIYLADTIGEMPTWYQHTKLVIMAGSFVEHGGQNIIEPASFAKPVITGPHTKNFSQDIAYFLKHDAIIQVNSINELNTKLLPPASTPCSKTEHLNTQCVCHLDLFGERAKQLLTNSSDIVERYLKVL